MVIDDLDEVEAAMAADVVTPKQKTKANGTAATAPC
jgi:predicted RNA-binding protein associated with RNAse of E/G family